MYFSKALYYAVFKSQKVLVFWHYLIAGLGKGPHGAKVILANQESAKHMGTPQKASFSSRVCQEMRLVLPREKRMNHFFVRRPAFHLLVYLTLFFFGI